MSIKIRTNKLHFSYQGMDVLDNLDFELHAHSITAIIGQSGTGKSTLLSVFNRLWEELGDAKIHGTVEIDLGAGLTNIYAKSCNIITLRQKVGMVFQTPNPLPFSIYKNIAFALELQTRLSKAEIQERVIHSLQQVYLYDEVKDRLEIDASKLSGGQQQRLCIARALALQPEILLLDEPTSSLDPKSCRKIEELLVELKKTCSMIIVSHYHDQIQRIADFSYTLKDGKLVTANL